MEDWQSHMVHAGAHFATACALLAQGDRAEALQHMIDAREDLRWAIKQLRETLPGEQS